MFEKETKAICERIKKGEIFSSVQLYILLDEIASDFVRRLKGSGISPDQKVPKVQGGNNLEQ